MIGGDELEYELVNHGEQYEFAREIIQKRGLIRAKYHSWEDYRNGLITYAGKTFLKVLFLTGVNMAATYYTIKISEVVAGLWEIKYTSDMATFYTTEGGESESELDFKAEVLNIFRGGENNGGDNGTGDEG